MVFTVALCDIVLRYLFGIQMKLTEHKPVCHWYVNSIMFQQASCEQANRANRASKLVGVWHSDVCSYDKFSSSQFAKLFRSHLNWKKLYELSNAAKFKPRYKTQQRTG